ncbi:TetR/AcrR family transcriptional regulator [Cryobacterium zhongshanensis]|uniref:TetR/AcrR family transcriptional regulator n=1 Tax=Cryobacterium zhongshanensis TaxID=2928153 RepID=A0AA41QT44_9MICO|nr:TetR/AcrR family transcriptional regulator [Cryobacterium zhongshanensis]MCI4657197.1 TetR/AcrR family transcriptional regulator [Cryobacterium zhongshanensis]
MTPVPAQPPIRSAEQSSTRYRILDAFTGLLIDQGERAATLENVAVEAGLSKGGLLYHFGTKDALVQGLLTRLGDLVATDIEQIRSAPAGPVDYLIRTSLSVGTALDRTIAATVRLAQGSHPLANAAMVSTRRQWLAVIEETVGDPDVAEAILLISDGLYFGATIASPAQPATDVVSAARLDRLLAVIGRMTDGPATP